MANDFSRITSVHNPSVKSAAKLRTRKGRRHANQIIIDGWREISRAIAAGTSIVQVFATPHWLRRARDEPSEFAAIQTLEASCYEVSDAAFSKIAFGERAEGVVAVAETPALNLNDLQLPGTPLIAVVEGLEKPGNLGAIVRSADGAGLDAVLVADQQTDIFNPNAVRASLGTIFCLPIVQASSEVILEWLTQAGLNVVAARVDAGDKYDTVEFTAPTAIVLGSEAGGLSPIWNAPSVRPIQLPMLGAADSLNVSATAAVLFYEARRQRGI